MNQEMFRRFENTLWPRGFRRNIWMLLDAARDKRIFPLLLSYHLEYRCLYNKPVPPVMEPVAPYLVQLEFEDTESRKLIEQAWGNSWGVVLRSDAHIDRLRRHFHDLLIVMGPQQQRLFFRFYDPRVLQVYLPTCNYSELRTVFGPVEAFWIEDAATGSIIEHSLADRQLVSTPLPLAQVS